MQISIYYLFAGVHQKVLCTMFIANFPTHPFIPDHRIIVILNFSRPYVYSGPYVYCFIQIFPPVRLFQTVRLFQSLEYLRNIGVAIAPPVPLPLFIKYMISFSRSFTSEDKSLPKQLFESLHR